MRDRPVVSAPTDETARAEVVIKATRHKGETWTVRVTFPDGSWAHHRGVVDFGYAGEIAERAVWKAEDMIAARREARDDGGPSVGAGT
jgi:hypothetical protein